MKNGCYRYSMTLLPCPQCPQAQHQVRRNRHSDDAALLHVLHRVASHIEVAEDVGSEGSFELLLRDVFKLFLMMLVSSIVDEHIQLAELLHSLFDRLAAEIRVAHVAGNEQAFTS